MRLGLRLGPVIGVLASLLVGQFGFSVWRRAVVPPPLVGPRLGEPLPAVPGLVLGPGFDSARATTGQPTARTCTMLVVVSTACTICQRMRYTWPARFRVWHDSVGQPLAVVWAAPQSDSEQAVFYRGFGLDSIRKEKLTDVHSLTRLGVYGTPTIFVIDRQMRLRIGILGDALPPADTVRRVCE